MYDCKKDKDKDVDDAILKHEGTESCTWQIIGGVAVMPSCTEGVFEYTSLMKKIEYCPCCTNPKSKCEG